MALQVQSSRQDDLAGFEEDDEPVRKPPFPPPVVKPTTMSTRPRPDQEMKQTGASGPTAKPTRVDGQTGSTESAIGSILGEWNATDQNATDARGWWTNGASGLYSSSISLFSIAFLVLGHALIAVVNME